jgi:hypothetical protein
LTCGVGEQAGEQRAPVLGEPGGRHYDENRRFDFAADSEHGGEFLTSGRRGKLPSRA